MITEVRSSQVHVPSVSMVFNIWDVSVIFKVYLNSSCFGGEIYFVDFDLADKLGITGIL